MKYVMPTWAWILVTAVLLAQGTWIFIDARRRGERAFLWGFFGLLNFPSSLVVYLLVTKPRGKPKACPSCAKKIDPRARFCPSCGAPQTSPPDGGPKASGASRGS
jgi:hypothetical protein